MVSGLGLGDRGCQGFRVDGFGCCLSVRHMPMRSSGPSV